MYIYVRSIVIASHSWRCVLDTTLCDKVSHWLTAARWFSSGTPVSSTNRTDRHDITEILFKVALNTITPIDITSVSTNLLSYFGTLLEDVVFYLYFTIITTTTMRNLNNSNYVHVIPATKNLEMYTPSTLSTTNYNSVLIHLEFI
jgi:hypothetical protein